MLDTRAIVCSLTAAAFTPAQVDAIMDAVRQAAEHEATDADALATKADLAAVRADTSAMETRLTWRLVGAMAAIGAILRFIG